MKAVYFEKHGGPDVLKFGEIADPSIGSEDVLIDVKACALNHLDIWVRQGLPGVSVPMPHIPGSDVSGVVLETPGRAVRARVAKWQTQRTQNPPVATPWEFDPPPGHQTKLARTGTSIKSSGYSIPQVNSLFVPVFRSNPLNSNGLPRSKKAAFSTIIPS